MTEHVSFDAPSGRVVDPSLESRDLLERIALDLSRARSTQPFVALSWPVAQVPSERLLAAEPEGEALLWAPPGAEEACGLGAAFTLSARGPDRFESIRAQADSVWAKLDAIPFGGRRSYGDLAKELGNPGASRAVGAANGKNPIAIIVPCHRVIGSDGSLTGYAGGEDRKRWLLDHEARIAGQQLALL
jgi:O-6-methylguanine DNA methyltransferase